MKTRCIIETRNFTKKIDEFLSKRSLLIYDFDELKIQLSKRPDQGDLVPGTGGIRKIRLQSSSKGKSGGFRICYYFIDQESNEIFLILIYQKNEQTDLSSDEKKTLKEIIKDIREY